MATIGANISYHNSSLLWADFFRKLGFKPFTLPKKSKTGLRNQAADAGTTFPRLPGICAKYSATTAPTTNTVADAPSGVGDICIYYAANNIGGVPIPVASISIYRCSAFTSNSVFTWTLVL